jgi:hypothetical protein
MIKIKRSMFTGNLKRRDWNYMFIAAAASLAVAALATLYSTRETGSPNGRASHEYEQPATSGYMHNGTMTRFIN